MFVLHIDNHCNYKELTVLYLTGKGVEDLDFYIGDEALDATSYSVKVTCFISQFTGVIYWCLQDIYVIYPSSLCEFKIW